MARTPGTLQSDVGRHCIGYGRGGCLVPVRGGLGGRGIGAGSICARTYV